VEQPDEKLYLCCIIKGKAGLPALTRLFCPYKPQYHCGKNVIYYAPMQTGKDADLLSRRNIIVVRML